MAANNYFGFTHGGTQYSAQAATPYPAAAPTAYVQPAQPTYAAAPRPQTYDTYQTTPTAGQYAYATRTQVGITPTATYDASKTYYTPAAAAPAAATAVYTVAEPTYQAAPKPSYTSTSYSAPTHQRTSHTTKAPAASSSSSYVYQTTAASTGASSTYQRPPATSSATYSAGYDAAVYSAATSYYQQQQTGKTGSASTPSTTNTWQNKKTFIQKPKPKQPPKQPQLHYCEVCKISCAGPQTYREHLEGQKHKKKEAAAKTTASSTSTSSTAAIRGSQTQLRCELCDVSCTGADAYAAHIRGAKHQKVLKLHTRLGKPIPSADPVVVAGGVGSTSTASSTVKPTPAAAVALPTKVVKPTVGAVPTTAAKKIVATPKITFVGGTKLQTTGVKAEEVKTVPKVPETTLLDDDKDEHTIVIPGEKDVTPVGTEYIEEVRNEFGNVVSFHCKLCECKFNDPNAKIMHMKGRRHRLQYKKKVDPSLQVEVKPSIRARKIQEEKLRRQAAKEEYWRRRDAEARWRMEWEQRQYEEEMLRWQNQGRGSVGGTPFGGMTGGPGGMQQMRRPDTSDDRHVMSKHTAIYPTEAELQAVQNIVSTCEKSLKLVSDFISDVDGPPVKPEAEKKPEVKKLEPEEKKEGDKKEPEKKEENQPPRALKGVMRVGVLAKGLLLHADLNVNLVVLCAEKPTRQLLERVVDGLPKQLTGSTEDKFEVKVCVEEAAAIVSSDKEPKTSCTITLTSPIMRDESGAETGESVAQSKPDPPDVLDRHKCLDALAALRHAKWFQARANGLQSCVVVIRILRDLCARVPTWTPLSQWAMELLVEKCVSSGGTNMSPGDALRRVFECIASGILLPGGPGLYDPCEKEATDAATPLTSQEREDITASAQHALRLIAFRQIHKVLGMDPLPQPRFQAGKRTNRKRRRTNSTGESIEEVGEGKKDKKDGEGEGMETGATESAAQS